MQLIFSHDLVSSMITINGILATFLSAILSCLITANQSKIVEYLKSKKVGDGKDRYEKLLSKIKRATFLNMLALLAGTLLILFIAETDQLQKFPFSFAMFATFLIYEIVCVTEFYKINKSVYLLLECL